MPVARRQVEPEEQPAIGARADDDPLRGCLHIITRLHGKPISPAALAAGLPLSAPHFRPPDFIRAAANHGYSAQVVRRPLRRISSLLLPATLLLNDGGACVLTRLVSADVAEIVLPESGFGAREVPLRELQANYSGYAIFIRPELQPDALRAGGAGVERKRSWFWGTLAAYAPYYLEAAFAGVLVNVLTVATSIFIMNVYDRVVPNNALETLIVLATGTAFAVGFEFLARTLRAYFLDTAGKKADLVLAAQIFAQALGLRMAERPASPGVFAAQLREFESVRDFITSVTLTALMDIPFVAFFIGIVAIIGGPLYVVPLAAVPLVLLVGLIAQYPLAVATRASLQDAAQRHGLLVEALEGVEMLKAMRAEGQVLRRYEDYTALGARSANTARMLSGAVVNFTVLVQQLVTIGVVFWGVHLIGAGELTMGALIACVILTGRGLAPLQQVASLMMRYQHARASFNVLNRLMRQPVERPAGRRFTHRGAIRGEIAMQGVHFTYPGAPAATLTDVSFALAAGEHVAVLGRIGTGKSTLLRLALGLHGPDRGTVRIDGVDLAQYDPADVRDHIGYVSQEPTLFHGTLRENIALGRPHTDDAAILRAARIAGIDGLIDGHPDGLQLPVGERGQGLSGGQRQAVANARAFLLEPSILLLDEPTSALDHSAEQRFITRLAEFAKTRTLILVTHKPTMLSLVSRILVLDNGRVVMDGPRDEVLRHLSRPAVAPG
jgi:ATP-binding cassette subfamily C protein LapB